MNVTVVNYANSNAHSILRALATLGIAPRFSDDAADIAASDYLILPGVGHAATAMAAVRDKGLVAPLEDAVFGRGVPVLGICLGMQIMVDHLAEGDCAGLGWVTGQAVKIKVEDRQRYKVPHIGWNDARTTCGPSRLLPQGEDTSFYFCHKYTVEGLGAVNSMAEFHYEQDRVAIFEKDNIFGVQFHPEKSQDAGQALFRRFFGKP